MGIREEEGRGSSILEGSKMGICNIIVIRLFSNYLLNPLPLNTDRCLVLSADALVL
jgi:hypothetical protein